MRLRLQRSAELAQEKQAPCHRGHERRWNPWRRPVLECYAEARALPADISRRIEAIRAADAMVALQEEAGADRVGVTGDECESAHEAVQAGLVDRQLIQCDAEAMRLPLPLCGAVLCGKLRLPECDVTGAADAVDRYQPRALRFQI